MIDENKYNRIVEGTEFAPQPEERFTYMDALALDELLAMRTAIDARLPATALKDMNLEQELVTQYLKVVALQEKVLLDERTPANQLAQVSNSVAATLQQLVSMQSKFHTSERLKEIEARLIRTLNKIPDEYVQEFFKWYEEEQ